MEREALEYLVGLRETEVIEVNGQSYSTNEIYRIKDLKPAQLVTTTLTALVDYLKSNIDEKYSNNLLVHIISPTEVILYSELREDKDREAYMQCKAFAPSNLAFNSFIDTERFNIMLQSSFIKNDDRVILLKVTGCIQDKEVRDVGDDGVSQSVTVKTGVAQVSDVLVPNPVLLAPYRTFPEVEQPESNFIFRMQSGPRAALFEADGGAWRNEAMLSIKGYLTQNLSELSNVKIIF